MKHHGDLHEMWVSSVGNTWGYDSYKQSGDNPRCSYILRKFMPGIEEPISWQYHYTQPWPIFRLGEIYLNYAEAKFELFLSTKLFPLKNLSEYNIHSNVKSILNNLFF